MRLVGSVTVLVACFVIAAVHAGLAYYVDHAEWLGFGLDFGSRSRPVRGALWFLALAHCATLATMLLLPIWSAKVTRRAWAGLLPAILALGLGTVFLGLSLYARTIDTGDMVFRADRVRLFANIAAVLVACLILVTGRRTGRDAAW